MRANIWRTCISATVVLGALLGGAWAQEGKAIDGGNAEKFKEKTFDLKEKEKVTVKLTFPAGKTATVTTGAPKNTDIHLFIYDTAKKLVAKDDSPGPNCELKLTPKEDTQYLLEVRNLGPGDNRPTLRVELK